MNPRCRTRAPLPLLALSLALLVAGCVAPPPAATSATPAGPAPSVEPVESATPEPALPASPTPPPTHAAPPSPVSSAPTPLPAGESLATLCEEAVFLSDAWGAGARQVLALGSLSSLAWHNGQLAYVVDGNVLLADLRGGEPRRLSDAPPAFLLGPELVWTEDGQALLTIADREDEAATETGRRLDIGVVGLDDGVWRPAVALADRAGATILRAEHARATVLLVAWGGDMAFDEALRYDLASGQRLESLPIAGQGEIAPSPDRRLAATTLYDQAGGVTSILVYDLAGGAAPLLRQLALPKGCQAVGLTWSPDGQWLSYLLREGQGPLDPPGDGRGIWVWNLEQEQAVQVVDTTDPAACPATWTPDSHYLVYRQADEAGVDAYYALDPAEGTARRLSLDPASRILGWVEAGS